MSDQPPPDIIKSYAGGIAARNAARQEERRQEVLVPDLSQAVVTHRPDQPQTMQQMAEAQRRDREGGPSDAPPQGLRPETIEGLKAVRAAQDAARAPAAKEKQVEAAPAAPEVDEDEAIVDAFARIKEDVIQNERERKAVAERVSEIDLSEGLLTGEFTQHVPIVPGKLEVRFRCLTIGENNELRMLLLEDMREDPRKSQLGTELLAFYQTVASVMAINKQTYARHMGPDATGRITFQAPVFREKLATFMAFPLPLIASLGTHGAWFEQRVRELFVSTDRLKNG